MSASREKRQRQGDPVAGLTQKQIQERKEAQIKKRNTVIYTVIGVIVAVLVVALLVWHSGFFQSRTTALTVDGRNYTPGEVAFYYNSAKQQNAYYLSMMGMYDTSKSAKEQYYDEAAGTTYYDYFMDNAKNQIVYTKTLADAAKEEGMTLSEDSQASVESQINSYKSQATQAGYPSLNSFLKAYFGPYMNQNVLRSCLEESYLANQYRQAHSDSLTYDDAALQSYYEENQNSLDTFEYRSMFFSGTAESTTDADGNTVEATEEEKTAAMEAAKEKADALLAQVEGGESFDNAANDLLGEEPNLTYDGQQSVLGSSLNSAISEWLTDSARKAGDVAVVDSTSGYYVVQFDNRFLDENDIGQADIRHILVKAEVAEGAEEPTDEAKEAAKEKAQSILDEFEAGDKTSESFAALANEYSEDPGSNTNGGLYEDVTENTSFFQGFLDWIFADGRKAGDTGLVENTQTDQWGWHVMYLDKVDNPQWKVTADNALRSADMSAWTKELTSGIEAVDGSGLKYVE